MAGDSEVNNPQKVQSKLKVKPKVRETKALPKANETVFLNGAMWPEVQ